jgi:hypothetical protein
MDKKPVHKLSFTVAFQLKNVRFHLCPAWPLVLTLNLSHIRRVLLKWLLVTAKFKLLTFQVQSLESIFLSLDSLFEQSIQARCWMYHFVTSLFFTARGCKPYAQGGGSPILAVRDCLFSTFPAIVHSWRPSLNLWPGDTPVRGDKGST